MVNRFDTQIIYQIIKETVGLDTILFYFLYFFLFCFGHTYSMQKFPGQGSGIELSHSRDNAKSSTTRPPGNSC